MLQNAITSIIPQATFNVRTYLGSPGYITVPVDINGVTIVQYSPFSAYDGNGRKPCNRVAEVKIFEELDPTPAVKLAWHPKSGQRLSKRDEDDDTCKWLPESSKAFGASWRRAKANMFQGDLDQSSTASSMSGITTSKSASFVTSLRSNSNTITSTGYSNRTSSSAIAPKPSVSYACYNYAAPHEDIADFCTCSNGASTAVASSTGNNTGSNYVPCPYTTPPPLPSKTTTTAATGGNLLYPFVKTLIDGNTTIVEECQSSTIQNYGGFRETMCAGNVITISAPPSQPTVNVTMGQNQVLVGTLTSDALYTSLSNALETLCPSPVSGSTVTVPSGTATIKGITWVESQATSPASNGELLVSIDSGVYSDAKLRTAMIQAAAKGFVASANGTNCFNTSWSIPEYHEVNERGTLLTCNAAKFAGVHYVCLVIHFNLAITITNFLQYGSVPFGQSAGTNTQWIEPHIDFGVEQGSFDCQAIVGDLEWILNILAPEFILEDQAAEPEIMGLCDAIAGD